MRELRQRAELALRILCLCLAGLVLYELIGMVTRWNPFRGTTVPELPALTIATNSPPGGTHGTNLMAATGPKGTNGMPHSPGTNMVHSGSSTNISHFSPPALVENKTNGETNLSVTIGPVVKATNTAIIATTNILARQNSPPSGTNSISANIATNGGSNLLLSASATGTNAASRHKRARPGDAMRPDMAGLAGMNSGPSGPQGKRGPDLPPAVQARISKITDSEILGPVMRPLPMALLGIAGNVAFLRSNSGQTGLEKIGDTLDDIKLLRIGVNRVLIEQDGQKKELTIFSGYGSDSLLQNDSTNENTHL
jgi:hypothetical protein